MRRLAFESLETRRVFAGVPSVAWDAPATAMLGQEISLEVTFDNTHASDPGFGPFIDVYLPRRGVDGPGGPGVDGISFVNGSATYLGAPVTTIQHVFTDDGGGTGTFEHPYARDAAGDPLIVTGDAGDQLLVFELPFGSFTSSQPAATVQFTAALSNLADLGTPLDVRSRGGFRFGTDALDNPATDPSIVSQAGAASAWTPVAAITPTLVSLTKTYIGPEDETATGPNFPRQYRIDIDVAPGQTITSADIVDLLPNNVQLLSVDTITPASGSVTTNPTTPANAPDNALVVTFASLTGTAAAVDASVVFSYFVPFRDADAAQVISPTTGNDVTSPNNARFEGDWTPIDPRDPSGVNNAVADAAGPEHVLTPKSIAVQKSVTLVNDVGGGGYSGGDTVQYTINFQISDYFAFDSLFIDDLLSDGQRFDTSFTPTLTVVEHGSTSTGTFDLANVVITDHFTGSVSPVAPINGSQEVDFDVSAELISRSLDGILLGGAIPGGGTGGPDPDPSTFNLGATTGQIVFRAIVQDEFSDDFPSTDPSVDEGDVLDNDVLISGRVRNFADLTIEQTESDDSGTEFSITAGVLSKSIYAINGNTALPSPLRISPGDSITYRLQLTLPSSDVEDLRLDDYLPLPVFLASTVTSFVDTVSAGIPATGTAKFGPDDTFRSIYGAAPSLSTDTVSNRVSFDYGDFDRNPSVASNIDILFTVSATTAPFADGLFLTNQVRRSQDSTNAGGFIDDAIVQIQLGQPDLVLTKGVVATDNPSDDTYTPGSVGPVSFSAPGTAGYRGSGPITSAGLQTSTVNSDVAGLDAGDIVTFAIVVENLGSSKNGAFDLRLRDQIPAGFVIPGGGLNLSVTDGTGAAYTTTTLGTGLFDPAGGIEIDDPGPTTAQPDGSDGGALDEFDLTSGRNVLVITYDLQLQTSVTARSTLTSPATLFNYSSAAGSADFTTQDLTDSASVQTVGPRAQKVITGTNQTFSTGSEVAVGEIITYQSVITVQEGTTPAMVWVDTPDAGLAIIDIVSVTASSSDLSAGAGSFAAIAAAANLPANGASATLNFGNVVNANTDNSVDETITVVYRAVVLNAATNNRGTVLDNSLNLSFTGGSVPVNGPDVTVIEPLLSLTKDISPATGQASDQFIVTLVAANTAAANDSEAFEVSLSDVLPAGLTFVGGLTSSGTAPTTLSQAAGTISASWDSFPIGSSTQIQFTVSTAASVELGSTITNTANLAWSSLPGDVTTPQSTNSVSTERTGNTADPGGAVNDLRASGSDTIVIVSPSLSKSLFGTNQSHTATTEVAIGEIATYDVTIPIAQGVLTNARFIDTPDAGLSIIDVISITGSPTLSTSIGSFAAVQSNAVVGAAGASLNLDFGQISNSDTNAATVESIVVRYRAVVLNAAGNNRGTILDNSGAFTWGTASAANVDGPDLTIVEPGLDVQTSIVQATGQANELVEVIIDLSHAGGSDADAMDVVLRDILPAGLIYDSGLTSAAGLVPTTIGQAGGTVTATWSTFPLASTSQIRFFARLAPGVQPGDSISNPASVTWTSLPGDVTTAQSSSGISTERTGSTSEPGSTANDHLDSASDAITILSPSVVKSLVGTNAAHTTSTRVAVGEIATYELVVNVPQGAMSGFVVTDTPDAGLAIVDVLSISGSPSVTSSLGGLAGLVASATIPASGNSLSIDFGTLGNSDADTATTETLTIRYRAVVLNDAGVDRGDVLDNAAAITWGVANSVPADGPDVTVVEPGLSISITSSGGPVDAGDVVTFTIDVAHTGTSDSDAFDVRLQNLIDSVANHLQFVPGSLTVTNAGGATSGTNSTAGGDLDLTWTTIPQGATSQIIFQAVVQDTAPASTTLDNAASVTWTSMPGGLAAPQSGNPVSTERSGNTSDPGGASNDHRANDLHSVTTRPPATSKTIATTSLVDTGVAQYDAARTDLTVGELVTFAISVVLPEGTNPLVITEQLPFAAGTLEFVSASVNSVGTQITAATPIVTPSNTNADAFNDRVVIDFGSVTNSPDGVSDAGDTIVVYVVGRVVDVPGNSGGVVLTADTEVSVGTAVSNLTAETEVVLPQLLIDKSTTVINTTPGSLVPYTITISHAAGSRSAAYDLTIADLLGDVNLDLVPGSVTTSRGTVTEGNAAGETTLSVSVPALQLGETVVIGFDARTNPSIASGVSVFNTSTLDYDSHPGTGGRAASADDNAGVTTSAPQPDLAISQSITQSPTVVNTPLQYTIVVTNNGPSTATGVSLNDLLPAGISSVTASTTQGTVNVTAGGVTGNLGTLLPGESVTVLIDFVAPSVASVITNEATVSANEVELDLQNNDTTLDTNVLEVSSINGRSWVDRNTNGIVDAGEILLPGVLITLTGTTDLGVPVLRTATTDANGNYNFDLLRPGSYRLTQRQPTLFRDNVERVGSAGGTLPTNDIIDLVLSAGVDASDYFFTELGLRSDLQSKRSLLHSRLRQPLTANAIAFADFRSMLGGGADLDGDGDVDNDDYVSFLGRLGEF